MPDSCAGGREQEEPAGDLRELEMLRRDASSAQRARDEFLSVASHELRTPLTTLQLQIQTLQRWTSQSRPDGVGRRTDIEDFREKLDSAERQIRRLVRLVETMIDVGRLDAERLELHPRPVDLVSVVTDALRRFEEQLALSGSRARIEADGPVVGTWDRARLEQMVSHVLLNAIQYGRGRPIEVHVRDDGVRARLDVIDHGVGIAPKDQERIFGRFERAVDDRSQWQWGFGVGLWCVRRILDAMRGDVRVTSVLGEGSTFTIELPLQPG